jgi:hypothetical protein
MSRPMEHEEAAPVGGVSKRGDGASGVPVNSAEISATLSGRAGLRSICAGPGRSARVQRQRLAGTQEAKWAAMRDWAS